MAAHAPSTLDFVEPLRRGAPSLRANAAATASCPVDLLDEWCRLDPPDWAVLVGASANRAIPDALALLVHLRAAVALTIEPGPPALAHWIVQRLAAGTAPAPDLAGLPTATDQGSSTPPVLSPDAPMATLRASLASPDPRERCFAAAHPRAPKAALLAAADADDADWPMFLGTAHNPYAPGGILATIEWRLPATGQTPIVALAAHALAGHPALPRVVAPRPAAVAAAPPPAPSGTEALRIEALRIDTAPLRLAELASHPSTEIRAAAAVNPLTPASSLAVLAVADAAVSVRHAAIGNIAVPLDALQVAWDRDPVGPAGDAYRAKVERDAALVAI